MPFYHVVSNEKLPHILNYPYRNTKQFEKELDFFLRHFEPVSLKELAEKQNLKHNSFHLSFDDGLRECADVIAPILLKKGIPATFFVNTAFINNKNLFHKYKASLILNRLREKENTEVVKLLSKSGLKSKEILKASISQTRILDQAARLLDVDFSEFLENQKPYLTTSQLIRLAKKGFSIGAHSHKHPEFENLSTFEQLEEIKTSMKALKQLVRTSVKAFSFPFTDWGVPAEVLQKIRGEHICDITFGTAGLKYDEFEFHLQRYPVEKTGSFLSELKGEWVYFILRDWIGKSTVKH